MTHTAILRSHNGGSRVGQENRRLLTACDCRLHNAGFRGVQAVARITRRNIRNPGAVGLPAATGIALLKPGLLTRGKLQQSRADIRQRTLQSEVLRLAGERQGRITIVEVVEEFAISPEEAKKVLDALAIEGMADFAVTDSGMVVYDFRELRQMDDKTKARGILDD